MCASRLLPLFLALLLAATPTLAADKKDANKEQKRLQQAQARLEKEKAQLTQEKTALETELGEAKKKADEEGRALRRQLDAAKHAKEGLAAKLADAEEQLRATRERLDAAEAERKRLDALASARKSELGQCQERNEKLYQQGREALDRYQRKSCAEALSQSEPFTGLKRVEIENYLEDSHEKLEEHRLVTR